MTQLLDAGEHVEGGRKSDRADCLKVSEEYLLGRSIMIK